MKSSNHHIVRISLIVALGGFLMGFDASVISGVVRFIEPEFNLTKIQLGWAVSSLTLAATIAMLLAGVASDRWGRKRVLFVAASLYAMSAIFSAIAPNFTFLVIARMLGGIGVGASLIIAPMYIAELSPPKVRGTMVSFNQLNIVIGISAAFFTNYLILKFSQSDAAWTKTVGMDVYTWRWMLGLESLPAVVYFIALFFVPASPRWLMMRDKEKEALAIMQKVTGSDFSMNDFEEVKHSLEMDRKEKQVKLLDIFKPALRAVLTIGIVLAILQQITGINSVFFYAPMIFEQAGLGTDSSFTQAIFVGLTNLVFTIVAMALIDRVGRRPLLLFGVAGIAISMFLIAAGFRSATYSITDQTIESLSGTKAITKLESIKGNVYTNDIAFKQAIEEAFGNKPEDRIESDILSRSISLNSGLILVSILTFVASFAVSLGPVMWVLFSELFPNNVRAIAISFVGFINSVISFSVQLVFPWELSNLGTAPTFFIYGLFAIAGLIFIFLKIPETKGKTLESLQKVLVPKK